MSTHFVDIFAATSRLGFLCKQVSATTHTEETETTPEGATVPETALCSEVLDGTFGDDKSKCADCFDIHYFNSMFSDGRNATVYD